MSDSPFSCRSCGSTRVADILDLGRQPLANSLRTAEQLDQPEPSYPLELVLCQDCSLVQINETVPPEVLFSEYLYFSSFSETLLKHAEALAGRVVATKGLGADSLVVEIASNDGYLLQYYKAAGVPVLGIEPASNIARWAVEHRGIPTLNEFFGEAVGRRLAEEGRRADVIHAHNVLAHVADLNGVVSGFFHVLKDDGVAIIEAPYLIDLIDHCEFDTIYHEHLCYFSLTALDALFRRHGLLIKDVERVPIHGGTLRIFASRQGPGIEQSEAVTGLLAEEKARGIDQIASYRPFADRVEKLKADLLTLLAELKGQGKKLAAYGASAKGSTLLNYFGVGRETLDFVVDRSTVKQGRYTPGTTLPIRAPEALIEEGVDYVLLLTWNFAEEILRQQAGFQDRGGRFILPIPEVAVI
ncbi:class I SAM-dependent methyltransferase [Tautonia sociabilis]|uniref:Class I SAM-dependent methyltransferase n=1 Tax=Tautonia sociabilis TaxID=2080755 RepID=A0A432MET6_9BACT|nr:class I SAM-dependent methyltransferase [Tautonia sociabilis]RUL84189.1 class I SAM-dependent methyltransferase [Tautonia sociabilis]